MTGLDALQSVQYVTVNGRRVAVVNIDDWEAMIEWLETVEDTRIAREALAALEAAGGSPEQAGWRRWEDVEQELD